MPYIDDLQEKIADSEQDCNLANAGLFNEDLAELLTSLNSKSFDTINLGFNNLNDDCVDTLLKFRCQTLILDRNSFTVTGLQRLIQLGQFVSVSFDRNGLSTTDKQQLAQVIPQRLPQTAPSGGAEFFAKNGAQSTSAQTSEDQNPTTVSDGLHCPALASGRLIAAS